MLRLHRRRRNVGWLDAHGEGGRRVNNADVPNIATKLTLLR